MDITSLGVLGTLSLPLFNAVFVTIYFLVSSFFGTCLRLNLPLGFARGCLSSTCISLCSWKSVIISLSLSLWHPPPIANVI